MTAAESFCDEPLMEAPVMTSKGSDLKGPDGEIILANPGQADELTRIQNEISCGIGWFKFAWMQKLASKKTYAMLYGLIGAMHFVEGTYFGATVSSLEKRFHMPSIYIGLFSSACDVGVIFTTLTVAYLGKLSHKPRWVAWGTALIGVACFMKLIPHWLYGPGENSLRLTKEFNDNLQINLGTNKTSSKVTLCGSENTEYEDCAAQSSDLVVPMIFVAAHFLQGIGSCTYYSLGVAYLDDNALKSKVPFLIAITQCLILLGPTFGFFLASFAVGNYVQPGLTPLIPDTDPRWVGAWWLGWGPLSGLFFLLALLMAMFPRSLPRAAMRKLNAAKNASPETAVPDIKSKVSLSDFKKTMTRLLKNKVLICNHISTVCFTFAFLGQYIFLPKYVETQYHQTASKVSLMIGSVGLIFAAIGIMVSAVVISIFRPSARTIAGWNVFTELLDCLGFIAILFISCGNLNFPGKAADGMISLESQCNFNCSCPDNIHFSPVCHQSREMTFFSPCHAGCINYEGNSSANNKIFSECSCLPEKESVLDGPCPVDCSSAFIFFVVIHCAQRFFEATGKAGNTLISFRCVSSEDKPVSVGFLELLLCTFAFIPGPLIYGYLIDSSCSLWGKTCGKTGNCLVYDIDKLRYYVNLPILAATVLGAFWDVGVWKYAKDLPMYDENEEIGLKEKSKFRAALTFLGD